jgi:cytochrome b
VVVVIGSPFRVAEIEHRPDGEFPHAKNGQLPRTHPEACHSPVGAVRVGATVSLTLSTMSETKNSAPGVLVQVLTPQISWKPK